jgi:hypothetical protein
MMAKNSKSTRTSSTPYDPLSRRIGDLKRERAQLEEEVLQLRAAVQIWTAVRRQIVTADAGSEAFDAEMR